jgi:hypothetical protein
LILPGTIPLDAILDKYLLITITEVSKALVLIMLLLLLVFLLLEPAYLELTFSRLISRFCYFLLACFFSTKIGVGLCPGNFLRHGWKWVVL